MKAGEVIREARPPAIQQLRDCAGALLLYPIVAWRNRDIIRNFYSRELRSRFRGTVLGFAWPFVLPLVLFAVYYFVFAILFQSRLGTDLNNPDGKTLYTIYLFVGVIVWTGFAESINRNASIILENSNLIKKIAFPSEILPLNTIFVSMTIQSIAIGAFLILAPVLGWNALSPKLAIIPLLIFLQMTLALGPSLAVAAGNVFVRDTAQILGIAMMFWQFATPVFWSPSMIKKETLDRYLWALDANPMYHLLEGYRRVLVNPGDRSALVNQDWPWAECEVVALWSLGFFLVGYSIFYISKRRFADEL